MGGSSISVVMKSTISCFYLAVILLLQTVCLYFCVFFNDFSTNNQKDASVFGGSGKKNATSTVIDVVILFYRLSFRGGLMFMASSYRLKSNSGVQRLKQGKLQS